MVAKKKKTAAKKTAAKKLVKGKPKAVAKKATVKKPKATAKKAAAKKTKTRGVPGSTSDKAEKVSTVHPGSPDSVGKKKLPGRTYPEKDKRNKPFPKKKKRKKL